MYTTVRRRSKEGRRYIDINIDKKEPLLCCDVVTGIITEARVCEREREREAPGKYER